MSYSQWESLDRTKLQTQTVNVDNFIELLVYSLDNLTTCYFIIAKLSISNRGKNK